MAVFRGALAIGIGNPLRHDDGVGRHVLEALAGDADIEKLEVLQLTPEVAEQITSYSVVIFIDAHVNARYPMIREVDSVLAPIPLTHVASPAEIVAIARALFGFSGHAYICRVPASNFSEGEGLSERSQGFVKPAAREIENLLAMPIKGV
jgi:hydrogenase maturation protease